jgi:hypothetical protein
MIPLAPCIKDDITTKLATVTGADYAENLTLFSILQNEIKLVHQCYVHS